MDKRRKADGDRRDGPPAGEPAAERPSEPADAAGHVTFDGRGRAVWEWKRTGDPEQDGTTRLLRRLDNDQLELADDPARTPRDQGRDPYGREARPARGLQIADEDPAGGFDPYDSAGPAGRRRPARP